MSRPIISAKHREAKDNLIIGLRTYIKNTTNISKAAIRMGMTANDLSKVLRLERAVSLPKLEEMGSAVGLRLTMRWERNVERD